MGISDTIAEFINEMLKEDSTAELQRSELANRFNCVPSQINYVISTRFSPERGYIVESRRGGGGYIRIMRVRQDPKSLMMHTVNALGEAIDQRSAGALLSNAVASGAMSEAAARLMLSAVGEAALAPAPQEKRDALRSAILKQMILRYLGSN
ncbi:MAG: CtsR family transcriptional regulator [Oscillospiraceae bacterium]|nr:CtsR family transcriptional regulator [Oscillospiraceae bacterium]